eukprot:gene1337-1688_t
MSSPNPNSNKDDNPNTTQQQQVTPQQSSETNYNNINSNDKLELELSNLTIKDSKEKIVKRKRIQPNLISNNNHNNNSNNNQFHLNYDLSSTISNVFNNYFSKINPTNSSSTTITTTTATLTSSLSSSTTIFKNTSTLIPPQPIEFTLKNTNNEKKDKKDKKHDKNIKKERKKRKSNIKKSTNEKEGEASQIQHINEEEDEDDEVEEEVERKKKTTKKIKIKRVSKSLSVLEPFAFLVTSPPNLYSQLFLNLKQWFERLDRKEIDIENNPFTINTTTTNTSTIDKEYEFDIESLLKEINNPINLQQNLQKFTIISNLFTLTFNNTTSLEQNKFLKLHKELWWVKTTNKWFISRSGSSGVNGGAKSSHMKVWFGLLILELWYRFIWARHTQSVYNKFSENQMEMLSESISLLSDASTTSTITTTTTQQLLNRDSVGSTSTSQEEDDDDDEDDEEECDIEMDEIGVEDISHDDTGKLNPNLIQNHIDLIPKVVPVFFAHATMTDSINEIESEFFVTGIWNISKPIETFVQFIHSYYRDCKNLPSLTFAEIHENIHKFYQKKYSKFIHDLGIGFYGEKNYFWKWTDNNNSGEDSPITKTISMMDFVDQILIPQFKNLTQDGHVSHSHNFYYLFPSFQEMKPPTHPITDYYISLKTRFEKLGVYNKEVEKIVETLDRLLEERQLIKDESTTNNNNNNSTTGKSDEPDILKIVSEYQQSRIKYLDQLINTLKAEYHKLTKTVDQLPSKKKSNNIIDNNDSDEVSIEKSEEVIIENQNVIL